jgi:hypothetical protein
MAGVFRVLVGLSATIGALGLWLLFIIGIMVVTLYVCRFIPMTGWRKKP